MANNNDNSETKNAQPAQNKVDIRRWLTRNKVFFETVTATLLAIMAIIISTVQTNISTKQTALIELQTEIAREGNLPHFSLAARQIWDTKTGIATEDKIYIINHGGLAQNVRCICAVFFDLEVARHQPGGKFTKHKVPINGYYSGIAHTATGTGLVLTLEGYKNNVKAQALERAFGDLGTKRQWSANMYIRRYIRLRYRDIFGNDHTEYLFVPLITGGEELTDEEGFSVFQQYEKAQTNQEMKEFEELTAEELMQIAESS